MNRKLMVMVVVLCVILAGSFACKKKEQQPVPQSPMVPGMGGAMPPGHPVPGGGEGMMMPKGDLQVIVPNNVKGKWSAVKIVVEDKIARKMEEYTIKLHGDLKIPNSNLRVNVGDFIPDFKMEVGSITSMSNEPNNPAVSIKVFEGSKEIFSGWLFGKFPAIHPFENTKIGLSLKEGVKKG